MKEIYSIVEELLEENRSIMHACVSTNPYLKFYASICGNYNGRYFDLYFITYHSGRLEIQIAHTTEDIEFFESLFKDENVAIIVV